MSLACAICGSTGVRRTGRAAWLLLMAGLLSAAWQAAAGTPGAVDEAERHDNLYGKGDHWQPLRPRVAVPVILWDEHKRKIPVN